MNNGEDNNQVKVVNIPSGAKVVNVKPNVINTNQTINSVPPQTINVEPHVINTNQNNMVSMPNRVDESQKKVKSGLSLFDFLTLKNIFLILVIIGGIVAICLVLINRKNEEESSLFNPNISYGTYAIPYIETPALPDAVSENNVTAVDGINWVYSVDKDNNAIFVYTNDEVNQDTIVLPNMLDNHMVTLYGKKISELTTSSTVFTNKITVKEIVVSEGVKIIGESAFAYIDTLENMTLPSTIEYIYDRAFEYSPKLSRINSNTEGEIIMPTNLRWYGNALFVHNEKINKFSFPKNINYIKNQTFNQCTGFNGELVIPGQYEYIFSNSFSHNPNVTKITIKDGVRYISGLENLVNVTEINLPQSLEAIEANTFANYQSLKKISFDGTLSYLGKNAINDSYDANAVKKTSKDFIKYSQIQEK